MEPEHSQGEMKRLLLLTSDSPQMRHSGTTAGAASPAAGAGRVAPSAAAAAPSAPPSSSSVYGCCSCPEARSPILAAAAPGALGALSAARPQPMLRALAR